MRFSLAFQPHSSNLFRPVLMLAIKIHVCRLNYTLALRVHAQLSHFYARFSNPNIRNYRLMITRLKGYNFVMFRVYKFSPPKKKKKKSRNREFLFLPFFLSFLSTDTRLPSIVPSFPELVRISPRPIREQQMRNLTVHKPRAKLRSS